MTLDDRGELSSYRWRWRDGRQLFDQARGAWGARVQIHLDQILDGFAKR
ncbi:MAG: hypothetical protein PVH76_05825 [Myxococcales bacterium]|jgi:hypothetical protein